VRVARVCVSFIDLLKVRVDNPFTGFFIGKVALVLYPSKDRRMLLSEVVMPGSFLEIES
jgi:hypothetical protein